MSGSTLVSSHYTHGNLIDAIRAGVESLGKSPETVTVEDLGPVEEFHIGGRVASRHFLDQLELTADHHVLDVGCGLGGTSRFVAHSYGSRVTGIDLTPEYVAAGRTLCEWVGLEDRIDLAEGSATELPYDESSFDGAFMLHVGMNIANKHALAGELFRVLKPGTRLGIYDVMRVGPGELAFPVPWARSAEGSVVSPPETYRDALAAAGFELLAEHDRREFALEFLAEQKARIAAAGGPPPLGLHILMGAEAPVKLANMVENIAASRVAPVELVAEKPA